jgi:hypothetical protein
VKATQTSRHPLIQNVNAIGLKLSKGSANGAGLFLNSVRSLSRVPLFFKRHTADLQRNFRLAPQSYLSREKPTLVAVSPLRPFPAFRTSPSTLRKARSVTFLWGASVSDLHPSHLLSGHCFRLGQNTDVHYGGAHAWTSRLGKTRTNPPWIGVIGRSYQSRVSRRLERRTPSPCADYIEPSSPMTDELWKTNYRSKVTRHRHDLSSKGPFRSVWDECASRLRIRVTYQAFQKGHLRWIAR